MTGESASFRLIPTRHIGDGELANEQTTNTKTAAIFIAHGYADAGVTKEGVAQTLEDISRAQETPPQFLSAEEKTKSSFFMLNPKEALTHIKQDFDKRRRAGKSGVLTSYVSCMALALASQPEDFSAIDIISPTLKRHKKWLPEDATLFTGGTEGRGFELLSSVLDWLEEKRDKETGQFEAPDEIIIAGHSLGGPTVSSFFEALATARSVDPRIRPERHDAFVAARAMFLGTDNEAPQSRVQVQLIDPGIDPQHSLLLPQKINDGEDDVPRRKKTIIFPLLKAIGGGVVEQTTAVLQSDLSVGSKVARLAFKLPQLTNAIGYSLRLPAVLHEAGPVVSSSSLHSFAKMTRLINQSNRNRQTDDKKSIVNVTFHEKDQIFPAELMERQLNDARKVYSMQMPLPEERGLHQAKHVANYVRSVLDGMKQPDALTDAALRKFARSRKISRLALRAAVDFRLSEPMKLSSTDTFEGGDYTVSVIPEGSHTSVGLRNDAEQVVQRLYDPDSVVLAA